MIEDGVVEVVAIKLVLIAKEVEVRIFCSIICIIHSSNDNEITSSKSS